MKSGKVRVSLQCKFIIHTPTNLKILMLGMIMVDAMTRLPAEPICNVVWENVNLKLKFRNYDEKHIGCVHYDVLETFTI